MRAWALVLLLALSAGARRSAAANDVESLLQSVARGPEGARQAALSRLRHLGPRAVSTTARSWFLDAGDPRRQVAGALALGAVRDASSSSRLRGGLQDSDPDLRTACAVALGQIPDRGSVSVLESCAARDSSAPVRRACTRSLGSVGGSVAKLTGWATAEGAVGSDLGQRLAALDALAELRPHKADRRIVALLKDPSEQVRGRVLRLLLVEGEPAAQKYCIDQLAAADEEARRAVVKVLADVPRGWALDRLVSAASDPSARVAIPAAEGALRRGDRRVVPVLQRRIDAGEPMAPLAQQLLDQWPARAGARP